MVQFLGQRSSLTVLILASSLCSLTANAWDDGSGYPPPPGVFKPEYVPPPPKAIPQEPLVFRPIEDSAQPPAAISGKQEDDEFRTPDLAH